LKTALLKTVKYKANIKKTKVRNRLIILFFCLLISTTLWLLMALDKIYTTTLQLPVNFINPPKHNVLVNRGDLPKELQVKVTGNGFDIVEYLLLKFDKSINIDLNELKIHSIGSKLMTVFKPNLNFTYFTSRIGYKLKVDKILPESIILEFSEKFTKKIPVILVDSLTFKQEFDQSGPVKLVPDSILVSGPGTKLDTLKFIKTQLLKLSNVNSTIQKYVKLSLADKELDFELSESKINVTIPVDKFTETTFTANIHVINCPPNIKIKIYPDKANLTFQVSMNNYTKLNDHNFNLVVDYNDIDHSSDKVGLKVLNAPEYIKSLSIKPQKTEYLIIK